METISPLCARLPKEQSRTARTKSSKTETTLTRTQKRIPSPPRKKKKRTLIDITKEGDRRKDVRHVPRKDFQTEQSRTARTKSSKTETTLTRTQNIIPSPPRKKKKRTFIDIAKEGDRQDITERKDSQPQ